MTTKETVVRKHWIYVLGAASFLKKAQSWADRKTAQGKDYMVIDGFREAAGQRLAHVMKEDVLYLYGDDIRNDRFGEEMFSPEKLTDRLVDDGLNLEHRSVKLFASGSGDGTPSFAEKFFEAMRSRFPDVVVHGYKGVVDPEGFDGHKTAGLQHGQSLDRLSRDEWLEQGSRAQSNRVEFRRV